MNQESMDAIAAKIHDIEPSVESVTFSQDEQVVTIHVVLGKQRPFRRVARNGVEFSVIDGDRV